MEKYPIEMDGVKIGTAIVAQQGLYTDILCRCCVPDGTFCRIRMVFADKEVDLGGWIREGAAFVVHKKVPKKILGIGLPSFFAVPRCKHKQKDLCMISTEKPFPYIKELAGGKLHIENDSAYMVF